MHVMVAVGGQQLAGATPALLTAVEATLSGRAYTRAFPGVYVVAIAQEPERAALVEALVAAVQSADPKAVMLISPSIPATAGAYNGLLPPGLWPEINSRIV